MSISIIAAMDDNRLIGRENDIPWHLPDDLKFFKDITSGSTVVMGRKTFESIGRPLANRKNIVLSKSPFEHEEVKWLSSVEDVLDLNEDLFIIGGSQIYEQFLPFAETLYLTEVHHEFEGDTYFPNIDLSDWTKVFYKKGLVDEKNKYEHDFYAYEKIEN